MAESVFFETMDEVIAAIKKLRVDRVERINSAKHKIEQGRAQIKKLQADSALYEDDIVWCVDALEILDAQIALLEENDGDV